MKDKEEKHNNNGSPDSKDAEEKYPSAELVMNECYKDYRALQLDYDKIYDKIQITIAFIGVFLGFILSNLNLSWLNEVFQSNKSFTMGIIVSYVLIIMVYCLGVFYIIYSLWIFFDILCSKKVKEFCSEDMTAEKIYKEQKANAALWIVDKYAKCSSIMRRKNKKKQKQFDKGVHSLRRGVFLYIFYIFLEKAEVMVHWLNETILWIK